MQDKNLNLRIENYWNKRSENFGKSRRGELSGADFIAWQNILIKHLPENKNLKILDAGTGAGFFAVILSKLGHKVTGIDMSEKMILQAEKISAEFNCNAEFFKMDAQNLDFTDKSFDVIVSRNLTWTLPDVMQAYREWHRVLKIGGMLINFDSDYGQVTFVKNNDSKNIHFDVSSDFVAECNDIKNELLISTHTRPIFDVEFLKTLNFEVDFDRDISAEVHLDKNFEYDSVEIFAIYAKKIA